MFGVSESREPIKGEFAKKIIAEVQRMLKLKKEGKDLHFENKDRETVHNIVIEDKNYSRWLKLMQLPLEDISLEDLQWAAEQPYNSLTSKNFFLAEIERRK